jgi:hypothetical protein
MLYTVKRVSVRQKDNLFSDRNTAHLVTVKPFANDVLPVHQGLEKDKA